MEINDSIFSDKKPTFREWMKEHQSGLYLTVIFHLIILILMTVQGIRGQLARENVFLFDYTKKELPLTPEEKEAKEQEAKKMLEQEVNEMIRQARSTPIRNVAVNADSYVNIPEAAASSSEPNVADKAAEIQKQLDETRRQLEQLQGADEILLPQSGKDKQQQQGQGYKGPSVISYSLSGRQALSMPVPAYKCQGGGDVTVLIEVNRHGYVLSANVEKSKSANDDCLHEAAIQAALTSRFTADKTAPEVQKGNIVYRFIAQ